MKTLYSLILVLGVLSIHAQTKENYLQRFSDPTQYVNAAGLKTGIRFINEDPIEPSFWYMDYRVDLAIQNFRLATELTLSNSSYTPYQTHSFSQIRFQVDYSRDLTLGPIDRIRFGASYQIPLLGRFYYDLLYANDGLQFYTQFRVPINEKLTYYPQVNFALESTPYRYFEPVVIDGVNYFTETDTRTQILSLGIANRLVYTLSPRFYTQLDLNLRFAQPESLGAYYDELFEQSNSYFQWSAMWGLHYVKKKMDWSLDIGVRSLPSLDLEGLNYEHVEPYFGLGLRYAIE